MSARTSERRFESRGFALTSGLFDAELWSPHEAQIVIFDFVSFEVDTFSMESEPDGIAVGREKDPLTLLRDKIV